MVEITQTPFAKKMLRPRTIIPAGDSITLYGTGQDATPELSGSMFEAAAFNSGMRIVRNAGVAGNTAQQLEARFQADVVDHAPDCTTIMIGTNNFTSGMANSAYADLFNSLENCVLMALDAGILPIIVCPTPKDAAVNEARRAQPFYYWLAEYYGLPLIDLYRHFVVASDGSMIDAYGNDEGSGIRLHPNEAGIAVGYPVLAAGLSDLSSLIGAEYLAAVSLDSMGDISNLLRNGSFALGTAPSSINGWTTGTTNNTITLEDPVLPQTGKVMKNVKSATGGLYFIQSGTTTAAAPGDECIFSGRIKTSDIVATGSGGVITEIAFSTVGGQVRPMKDWRQNGDFRFSLPFVVPEGSTAVSAKVYSNVVSTVEISNLTLINRTAMAAIWAPGQQ